MPRTNKARSRAKSAGLRTWRQKIDLDGAVVCGPTKLSSIVYCYSFPSCPGRIKIGYSSRGLARIAEQSTAFPEKPKVLFVIHDPKAKEIEAAFHIALSDRQSDVMGTEWFDAGWPELLRVSPTLRRALGVGRMGRWMKGVGSSLLCLAGLLAAPPLMAAISGLIKGLAFSEVLPGIKGYGATVLAGDWAVALEMGKAMIRYAFAGEISPAWPLLGMAPAAVLAWLPWKRPRRQAV